MIIQCRASSFRKTIVSWISFEIVSGIRRSRKEKVLKMKEFDTFEDANGFARGLEKRGILIVSIQ